MEGEQLSKETSEQLISQKEHAELASTYFGLMQKVGTKGKYQIILTITFSLLWYVTGIVLMSTAFLFLNPSFSCETFGLLVQNCRDYVCSLQQSEWVAFITESDKNFKSLANAFGDYYCDNEITVNIVSTFSYFGALAGYVVVSFFSDNWGRRPTLIVAWSICILGIIILIFAPNFWITAIGLFLMGFGSDTCLNISFVIIAETFEDKIRQEYSSLIQGFFTAGALFVTLIYYLSQDYKVVTIYALLIPSALSLLLIIFFVQDTPLFLIKKSPEYALEILNKIGLMNMGRQNCVTMDDIQNVMDINVSSQYDSYITPLDLFRFGSLRFITICMGIISIVTYFVYYGPTLIVDQIGFDIYTSNVVLNVSDLLTYYPLYLLILTIRRRISGVVLFSIATGISIILIFFIIPSNCGNDCPQIIVQLAFIFVFRFAISMNFAIINIYGCQLYPTRAKAIGNGILGSFGTIASATSPLIMGAIKRADLNSFIFFAAAGILAIASYTLLPETLNVVIPQEIQEVEYEKNKKYGSRLERASKKSKLKV